MSLVRTLGWYRRHHARHPDLALWPRSTAVTRDDVVITGESMTSLARAAGTPCTRVVEVGAGALAGGGGAGPAGAGALAGGGGAGRVGAGALAAAGGAGGLGAGALAGGGAGGAGAGEGRDGRSSSVDRYQAVVVSTVEVVTGVPGGPSLDLWLDAELDGCVPLESTFRLIGRESRAEDAEFVARPCRRYGDVRCILPADVRGGDLIAFVVAHPVALHDLRRRAYHPERLG